MIGKAALFVTLCRATALAAGGQGCVTVSENVVRLHHILPPEVVLQGAAESTADEVLFPAPGVGSTRLLGASERTRLLARHGITASVAGICIRSKEHRLNQEEIQSAIRAVLSSAPDFAKKEIRVEVVDWSKYQVAEGSLEFSLKTLPRMAMESNLVLWRGAIRTPSGRSFPIWAKVRLTVEQPVAVAQRNLPTGHRIDEGDVVVEKRLLFPTAAMAWSLPAERLAGRTLRRAIAKGQTIAVPDLQKEVLLQKGSVLSVEVHEGAVRLKVEAVAEGAGRKGDTVWFHVQGGNQRFQGIVLDQDQIRIVREEPRRRNNSGKGDLD